MEEVAEELHGVEALPVCGEGEPPRQGLLLLVRCCQRNCLAQPELSLLEENLLDGPRRRARTIEAVPRRAPGETEPGVIEGESRRDVPVLEVHADEAGPGVSIVRDHEVAAVGRLGHRERQVADLHVPSRRRDPPAIGKERRAALETGALDGFPRLRQRRRNRPREQREDASPAPRRTNPHRARLQRETPGGKKIPVPCHSERSEESALHGLSRSFASPRACPELEGATPSDRSRSFAALRMTRDESEGMTRRLVLEKTLSRGSVSDGYAAGSPISVKSGVLRAPGCSYLLNQDPRGLNGMPECGAREEMIRRGCVKSSSSRSGASGCQVLSVELVAFCMSINPLAQGDARAVPFTSC